MNLHSHIRSDRGKWAFAIISILLILAICGWLIAAAVMNVNAICLFKHNYNEETGVCSRCGGEKPAEEVEPQAYVSEQARLFASSRSSTVSGLPDGLTLNILGEVSQANCSSVLNDTSHFDPSDTLGTYMLINGSKYFNTSTTPDRVNLTFSASEDVKLSFYCESNTLHNNSGALRYLMVHKIGSNFCTKINLDVNAVGSMDGKSLKGYEYSLPYGRYEVYIISESYYDEDMEPELDYVQMSGVLYIEYGISAVPSAPSKTGYDFTGWYTDEACTNKYTASTVTADITLYAGFRAHTYSIKFNANSGSGTMANLDMTYDQAKNLTDNTFIKEHYAFKGWSTSSDGDIVYSDKQSVKNLTAADGATVELFAQWERSEVKVDFVSNGVTTTTWIAIGTKATLHGTPTKAGHTFVAWLYDDGTIYNDQTISEDIILTAYFEVIQCTVTFIVDGEVYATYICDWGTSLAEALNANDINPLLMSVEDEYSRNF